MKYQINRKIISPIMTKLSRPMMNIHFFIVIILKDVGAR